MNAEEDFVPKFPPMMSYICNNSISSIILMIKTVYNANLHDHQVNKEAQQTFHYWSETDWNGVSDELAVAFDSNKQWTASSVSFKKLTVHKINN